MHMSQPLALITSKVKITGRVIQSKGVQAIAVQKVERQHSGSTASVDRN